MRKSWSNPFKRGPKTTVDVYTAWLTVAREDVRGWSDMTLTNSELIGMALWLLKEELRKPSMSREICRTLEAVRNTRENKKHYKPRLVVQDEGEA